MPHTMPTPTPVPLLRDRGIWAAVAWLLLIVGFNLSPAGDVGQITGLAVAAPFLAAALVQRPSRVIYVGALTLVAVIAMTEIKDLPWTAAANIRLVAVVVATAVSYYIVLTRIRAARRTVDINEIARAVQRAVMRLDAPSTPRATVALRYRAADVDALIGGDALEVVQTKWGLRILIADARGKGLGSLRASTLALGTFREWAHEEADLCDLLERLHHSLDRDLERDEFVTALVVQLDDLSFSFASAGHPFPVLIRQHVTTELALDAVTAPPLAMDVPRRRATTACIQLMAGDVLLMVTDGMLEARDRNRTFFPFDLEAANCCSGPDIGASIDELLASVSRHSGGRVTDDIAVAGIRIDDGHRPPVIS